MCNQYIDMAPQLHLVIPPGTKVLTRATGRVGLVTHTPATPNAQYQVRFADNAEAAFHRHELTIFKQTDAEIPNGPTPESLLPYVIYRAITGSTAYGLNHENSDIDRRGFYLPPAHLHWGLAPLPEQLETENEECYWEIEKFIRMALKANPNVLECLYSPLVETATPLAQELIEIRHIFLSRHIHRTHNAYVLSQFKKLEQDLRNQRQIKWKHAMHLIRLLLSGISALRHGTVELRVDAHREVLLSIRRGERPWPEVDAWRLSLHRELDDALAETKLPEHPDYEAANAFLIHARRHAATPLT